MRKNIFSVFQNNDTDDEDKQVKKPEPVKLTKKEARAEDQLKREVYGDRVEKEEHPSLKHHDYPRKKDDYKSGEKRPFERHSGTGRPAFTNDFKKGGHGKGNVGGEKDIQEELGKEKRVDGDRRQDAQSPIEIKPEPVEEIITLDEYISKGGFNADFLKKPEVTKPAGPIKVSDSSVKVVAPREREAEAYSKKNVKRSDDLVHAKGTNVALENQPTRTGYRDRNANPAPRPGKSGKVEFNEQNFPALS
jgi:hypothetical protein